MSVLKMKPGAKARRDRDTVHHDSKDSSPHVRGISPVSGGRSGSFYSAGPVLSLKGSIQPKLSLGQPNDIYEQEADRVADQVMSMPESKGSVAQRKAGCPECPEKEEIQTKPLAEQMTPLVQQQAEEEEEEEEEVEPVKAKPFSNQAPSVNAGLPHKIQSVKGSGEPLPNSVRHYFEPRFGSDFSQVRVHTDAASADTAKSINAKAFTVGKDMAFADGQYSPGTTGGNHLIAHELTHVVQQGNSDIAPNRPIQRDTATPAPSPPTPILPDLTPAQIRYAIWYNRVRYDRRSTILIQMLVGAPLTGIWDNETIHMIAEIQEEYGLRKDGKVGLNTFRFLDLEQAAIRMGTSTAESLLKFKTPRGNIRPYYRMLHGFHSCEAHFKVEAQFSERANCGDWEYRQEIKGNAWGQKPGHPRINLNHYFTALPSGRLDNTWKEDGNANWAGRYYGRRRQPGRAIDPINRYEDHNGRYNQRNGCIYKGEDSPRVFDAAIARGDTLTLDLEFAGGIYRRDPNTDKLVVVTRRTWTVNGSIIVP